MIGVFGGSFDPIHFGHINPLIDLSKQFNLSEIKLIPTYRSAVGKTFHADFKHRLNMVSIIASSETNNFRAEDLEIRKKGISYTHETIKILQKDNKKENICLIMGLDVFLNIETWYNYEKILKEVNILVINRPGFEINKMNSMGSLIRDKISKNKKDFLESKEKNIFLYHTPSIDISSSSIRDIIKKGKDPLRKIPGSIMSYIKRNNLYKKYE